MLQYVQFAQEIRFYGYWKFDNCVVNYSSDQIQGQVWIGEREICFKPIKLKDGSKANACQSTEVSFHINRIRCWRLTTIFKVNEGCTRFRPRSRLLSSAYEFAFEHLQPSGKLKWITVRSDQAIVMASCLQKIVQEMLDKRETVCQEIQFDLSRRICNYWKKSSSNPSDNATSLTKSISVDAFYVSHSFKTTLH
jgi:hypothetical protein